MTAFQSVWSRLDAINRASPTKVIEAKVASHDLAIELARRSHTDVALVDALRHENERTSKPGLSLQGGVQVAQAFLDASSDARVVAYSARANDPAINITIREVSSVCALYDSAGLLNHMAEALWGLEWPNQVRPPTEADYASLNLLPTAKPWEALKLATAHHDAWQAVVDFGSFTSLPVTQRDWFNDKLHPLLPLAKDRPKRRYPELIKVLRRLAFFG